MMKKITSCLLLLFVLVSSLVQAATQTINVNLTTSSPTYNRTNTGNPPSSLSPQTQCYYSVFSFTAPVGGNYTFTAIGTLDNFGTLYQNAFLPSSPLTNAMRANDDYDFADPTNKNYGFSRTLTAGTTYYLVSTMFFSLTPGNYQVNITGPFATPLPVEMTDFTARFENGKSMLNWKTVSEKNCKGFQIQRSLDGERFENIGYETSKSDFGTSNVALSYDFTDVQPLAVNYYRLVQEDLDGHSSYSEVLKVVNADVLQDMTLFPNPANNQFSVQYYTSKTSKIDIIVTDFFGRAVSTKSTNSVIGNNLTTMDVSNVAFGMYLVTININGKKASSHRLIKN